MLKRRLVVSNFLNRPNLFRKKAWYLFLFVILGLKTVPSVSAQATLLNLEDLSLVEHPYFTHSSHHIYTELLVREDKSELLTIDDVINNDTDWQVNQSRQHLEGSSIYWTRLDMISDSDTSMLFEFGQEKLSTWEKVDYYLARGDSILFSGQTGIALGPQDKEVRSALNLAWIPVKKGTTQLYSRLETHYLITDDLRWSSRYKSLERDISFYLHDASSYSAIEAYKFPGFYSKGKRGHFFKANFFKQCLEVSTDISGRKEIDEIVEDWDEIATYKYDEYPHRDSIYWLRFKVIGTNKDPGSMLFGLSSGTHWNFDTIVVYTQDYNNEWLIQKTGNKVSNNQKSIPADWNLFKIKVAPLDTQDVYLRLSGAGERFVPEFSMVHFDETSFWTSIFKIQWIYGAFFGILIVQSLYFLIVGFIEKEGLHFWFVCMIVGFGLSLGFVGGDVNYFLFPAYESCHPWIAALGGFMIVLGLYRYLAVYLSVKLVYGLPINYFLTPFIIVHFLICIYFGIMLHSIGGSIAVYETYFQVFFGSIIINFFIALILGIRSLIHGNMYAKYFVGAFTSLILILIIRLVYAFGSFGGSSGYNQETIQSGLYVHYLLFLGVIITIVLLGFGNGHRISQFKLEAAEGALKSSQKEEVNELLREKNTLIEQRAEENEVLLKEIHHRVKNNLQILGSLLNLQAEYIDNEEAYEAIMRGKSRVEAMGLVHQLLYLSDVNIASVDMSEYMEELCHFLEDSFNSVSQEISIFYELEVHRLDLDTVIPLGLTITELVTNSKKHAFGDRKRGTIYIRIWINSEEQLCLQVADDGIGIEKSMITNNDGSFGNELIRLMTKKLKGTMTIMSKNGYVTTLTYDRYKHYTDTP